MVCLAGVEAGVDLAELGRDAAAEGPEGDNGDDGDEGQEQAVLHHARTALAVDVELGLDPGLQNEKVHDSLPRCWRRGADACWLSAPACASMIEVSVGPPGD